MDSHKILKIFSKNYLSNRSHETFINKTLSNPLNLSQGLPQNSKVGPLMFLYVNDLGHVIKNGKYKLFADDTTVYYSDNDIKNCISKLNDDLISIKDWCSTNSMAINVKRQNTCYLGKETQFNCIEVQI